MRSTFLKLRGGRWLAIFGDSLYSRGSVEELQNSSSRSTKPTMQVCQSLESCIIA